MTELKEHYKTNHSKNKMPTTKNPFDKKQIKSNSKDMQEAVIISDRPEKTQTDILNQPDEKKFGEEEITSDKD